MSTAIERLVAFDLAPTGVRISGVTEYPGRDYSGLMLAARITLAHFSVSSTMSWPNAPGLIGIGSPPSSTNCALIFRSASAVLISLLSLSMTSVGVLLGEPRPDQPLAS